jgi:hypothetical protein
MARPPSGKAAFCSFIIAEVPPLVKKKCKLQERKIPKGRGLSGKTKKIFTFFQKGLAI